MVKLNYHIIGLCLWLAFFYNVERIEFPPAENIINIATSVYILSFVLVVLGIWLPQWQFASIWTMILIASVLFVAVKLLDSRPYWGGIFTYLTLFEFTSMLFTVVLAYGVGRSSADFVRALRELMFAGNATRIHDATEANEIIRREILYSRRRNRAFSVMVVESEKDPAKVDLSPTAKEIERLFVKRYSLVALGNLIAKGLRRTDFIVDESARGRFVLLVSDIGKEQAGIILNRLAAQAQKRVGIELQCGVATFPEEGLTFDDLVEQAERDLRGTTPERRKEDATASSSGIAEEHP